VLGWCTACAAYQVVPLQSRRVTATASSNRRTLSLAQLREPQLRQAPSVAPYDSFEEAERRFNATWYAVAYSEQLGADQTFATRLWGEPLVLYRPSADEVVCVRDSCPHRSAPLSMGDVQDGVLRCFYHGWGFGSEGKCVNVPTMGSSGRAPSNLCAKNLAVVESDGVLWVWRGHPLAADASKLPRHAIAEQTFAVDTTLDYACEWTRVMENHLAPSTDETGPSSPGTSARFNAPNVVCHQRREGILYEESHIVPIAPQRTRVMLRQHFEMGPVLSALLQLPGSLPLLTWCVRNWNYRVAQEGYESTVRGQEAQDGGVVARFRAWHQDTLASEGQPYFTRWDDKNVPRYGPQVDDAETGTYGLKKNYVQNNPKVVYAPLQS